MDLLVGLFLSHVGHLYAEGLIEAGIEGPVEEHVKLAGIREAILEVAGFFPDSIRSRFEADADRLAAELIGGGQIFPRRR